MNRQEWLSERRKGIGASEAAAILGLNPHMTPLEVWLSKVNPEMLPERKDEDFLEFGTEVEGPIERRYIRDTGNQVYHPTPAIIVHPKYPELICTPDGMCDSPEKIVVEYKFERFSDNFGDPGTDEIPEHFLIQGSHQMACSGRNRVDFGVLHGAPPIRIYRAYRDLELEAQLIERLRGWWSDYVVKQVEPPIDSSTAWADYLKRKHPRNTAPMLTAEAGSSIEDSVVTLKRYIRDMEQEQARVETLKNEVKAFIGDNDGLLLPDGSKVTWRRDKDSTADVTDYGKVVGELIECGLVKLTEVQEFIHKHTRIGVVTRKGARKFIISEASCTKKLTAKPA